MEENQIEKLVITLTNKDYAEELKNDMVEAGVPTENFEISEESDKCVMTINDVYDYLVSIINMFRLEPYNMTIREISKLLNIELV